MTSRILLLSVISLFVSACGGSSGGDSTSPPPPPTNAAPVVDAGTDATIQLPEDTVDLDGTVTDDGLPAGATLSTAWSVQSGPDGATFADPNAVDTTVTFVNEGTYVLELAADDTALQGSDTVTIVVQTAPPANVAPIADAGPDQSGIFTGATVTLDGSGSSDADGDALTYAWTLTTIPAGSAAALSDATAVGPTFVADVIGSYVAQLVVNDGTVDSAPDSVTIVVEAAPPANQAPTADAGLDQPGVSSGATVFLNGSGSSDPDGDPLTYSWTLPTVPAGSAALLSDGSAVAPTFVADVVGTYVAQLVVNDGTVDSAPDTVTITVANTTPIADAGPDQTFPAEGVTVTLDGSSSSDADGDPLTYAWTLTAPAGSAAALSDATVVGPTFDADLPGNYVAELVVNDGTVDSAPDTVTVSVGDTEPAAPAGLTASGEDGRVDLDWADNTEPDLAASPYRVLRSETPGGPYTDDVSGLISASSYADTSVANGTTYYYVVTAEDATGNVSPESAEVAVTPNEPVHAYWTMEEGVGTTTADTVALGGNSDGTLVGPIWVSGVDGFGLDFNGTSDFVVIDNTPELQITGTAITLMAWIYPREGFESPGPGLPAGSRVISKRTDAGGHDVYAIKIEDYRLCFRIAISPCQYSDHFLVLNEWLHVAMVYDGVDKRIYVNGVLDESGPEPWTAPIVASSTAVHLGTRENEGRFFNGVLDEVQILNTALTEAEVQAVYAAITPIPPPAPGLRFTDITEDPGTADPALGSRGIMFAEVDGDNDPDYYLTKIPENVPEGRDFYFDNVNGITFTEVAEARGIDDRDGGSYGAVWADLDNDGDYDLFNGSTFDGTTGLGENNNVYCNACGVDPLGTFTDLTPASISSTELETRGVTAFDMDGDGDLDLFGVSSGTASGVSEAYLNGSIGGAGDFSFTSHVGGDLTTAIAINGVTDTDYDNDGDIDVLAANNAGEFAILQNDGSGSFTQILPSTLNITNSAVTGITPGDVDNDGDLDLLLTGQGQPSYLYRREINGSYVLQEQFVDGWMGSFADLDNDGDLDLVFSGDFRTYLNNGDGTFDAGQTVPVSEVVEPRAIAVADIDSDGDLDFMIAARSGRNTLVQNNIDTAAGNYLRVELVSPTCQAGAFGARTTVYAAGDLGGTILGMRESRGNHGYYSQNDPVLHFGLGSVTSVDVEVTWVDGTTATRLGEPASTLANPRLVIDECTP